MGGGHRKAEQPQDMAADDHREQPRDIGREVEKFRVADRADQPEAAERDEGQGQERAGAGTEEAVVETERGDDEGEAERAGAGAAINAAHRGREPEIRSEENTSELQSLM